MSKRHFELLAAIVRELPPDIRRGVARQIAGVCAASNPRFSWTRFALACEVEP